MVGPQTEAANVNDITITIPAAVVRLTAVASCRPRSSGA